MITGTPTTRGVYPVTLTVTDSTTTRKSTVSFSWTTDYPPMVATNPGPQTSTVSTADSVTLSVTGGSGSFAWTGGGDAARRADAEQRRGRLRYAERRGSHVGRPAGHRHRDRDSPQNVLVQLDCLRAADGDLSGRPDHDRRTVGVVPTGHDLSQRTVQLRGEQRPGRRSASAHRTAHRDRHQRGRPDVRERGHRRDRLGPRRPRPVRIHRDGERGARRREPG